MIKMLSSSWFSLALVATVAIAQTPTNFSPNSTNHLSVAYGTADIVAGTQLSVDVVATQPALSTATFGNGTYVVLMIDPDAKFNGSDIEVLHWLQQDLTNSHTTTNSSLYALGAGNNTGFAPYVPPAPPAELPPRAHRYIQLLFEQPTNFTIPSAFATVVLNRVGFDLVKFVAATGLGPVLAANYFLVTNTSAAVVTSSSNSIGSTSVGYFVASGAILSALIAF